MRFLTYNNKICLSLKDNDGEITPFQLLLVATSGHGKGMSSEAIAERWKKSTGGVTIFLNDPKQEAEQSFVMYEPIERYHLKELKRDRIKKRSYPAKLYHPYTHNLSKTGFLPKMNIYTLSIKDMTKEDWSILAESDSETETIKLLERVSEDLPRNSSIFDFLHEIERLTEGKKEKNKAIPDPKNWFLKSGGGTAKSIKQIGNMLSSFKKNYFLRKDTCDLKLNWDDILLDSENYHIFLTNWIDNPKLRNFLVEVLMGQAIKEAQRLSNLGRLKKPILFIIPELINVCPSETKGSSLYLAKALRKHLVAMRSQAGGMSVLADTQIWSQTSPEVRSSFNQTFYGNLNPEDARIIFKANSYNSTQRELFEEVKDSKGSFIWYKNESYGIFSIFTPSHMHKEVKYNWIQMYKKYFKDKMVRYDDLVKKMKNEYNEEESRVKDIVFKELEKEEKEKEKDIKPDEIKKPKIEKDIGKEYLLKRAWELHCDGLSDRKIAQEIGVKSNKTAKNYYLKYKKKLELEEKEKNNPDNIKPFIGHGVLEEEIDMNF